MLNQRNRLDKSDAEFVDVYYTNRHIAGEIEHHVGHVDVYINGGRHQPGCLSHNIIHTSKILNLPISSGGGFRISAPNLFF